MAFKILIFAGSIGGHQWEGTPNSLCLFSTLGQDQVFNFKNVSRQTAKFFVLFSVKDL